MHIPKIFPKLISMINDVPEEKWESPKDSRTTRTKANIIRSYLKIRSRLKFARSVVYNLQPEKFIESVNSRDISIR